MFREWRSGNVNFECSIYILTQRLTNSHDSSYPKSRVIEVQRSKNFHISTSFGRSKIVTTKKKRLPYVQKLRLYDVDILRPHGVLW